MTKGDKAVASWLVAFAFSAWVVTAVVAYKTQTYHDSVVPDAGPQLSTSPPQAKSGKYSTERGPHEKRHTTKRTKGTSKTPKTIPGVSTDATRAKIRGTVKRAKTIMKKTNKKIKLDCDINSPLGCAN